MTSNPPPPPPSREERAPLRPTLANDAATVSVADRRDVPASSSNSNNSRTNDKSTAAPSTATGVGTAARVQVEPRSSSTSSDGAGACAASSRTAAPSSDVVVVGFGAQGPVVVAPSSAMTSDPPPPADSFQMFLRAFVMEASLQKESCEASAAEAASEWRQKAEKAQTLLQEGKAMVQRTETDLLLANFEQDRAIRTYSTDTGWIVECGGARFPSGTARPPRFVRPELRSSNIRRIACGGGGPHGTTAVAAALTTEGECFAWQPDGDQSADAIPPPQNPDDYGIVQVASTKDLLLLLSGKGKMYACLLDAPGTLVPVPVVLNDENDEIVGLVSGPSSDALLAWSRKGVLVLVTPKERGIEPGEDFSNDELVPLRLGSGRKYYIQELVPVQGEPGTRVAAAAVGGNSVYVSLLDAKGRTRVYSAGANQYGQLGHGSTNSDEDNPLAVIQALRDVSIGQLASGNGHALALTIDKTLLYAWGRSDCGQLGHGRGLHKPNPVLVFFGDGNFRSPSLRIVDITAGDKHCVAKTQNGEVYVWGSNQYGQLGHDVRRCECIDAPELLTMKIVGSNEPVKVLQVVGGIDKTFFLVSPIPGPHEPDITIRVSNDATSHKNPHESSVQGNGASFDSLARGAAPTGFLLGPAPVPAFGGVSLPATALQPSSGLSSFRTAVPAPPIPDAPPSTASMSSGTAPEPADRVGGPTPAPVPASEESSPNTRRVATSQEPNSSGSIACLPGSESVTVRISKEEQEALDLVADAILTALDTAVDDDIGSGFILLMFVGDQRTEGYLRKATGEVETGIGILASLTPAELLRIRGHVTRAAIEENACCQESLETFELAQGSDKIRCFSVSARLGKWRWPPHAQVNHGYDQREVDVWVLSISTASSSTCTLEVLKRQAVHILTYPFLSYMLDAVVESSV